MFEPHVSSTPYFVGVDHGKAIFGIDVLMVNPATNEQYIGYNEYTIDLEEEEEYVY